MSGGANALELLWAVLALALVALLAVVCVIGWLALRAEARLAGSPASPSLLEMPELLVGLATGQQPPLIEATVAAPWRPITVAAVIGLAVTAGGLQALKAWSRWRAGWRHRRRMAERLGSHSWARRRDLAPLLAPQPRPGGNEPSAEGRLLVGTFDNSDVLVPAATSVIAIAPTRTGKSTRLVVPNLLRWDGPAVVTSVKRDVYDLTATRRAEFGPVSLFDPTGATGLDAVRWSPLLTSTTFPAASRTATWLAEAAAVEDKQDAAKFWQTLATKLLAPMLFAAAKTGASMHDVAHWVDRSAFDEVAAKLADLGDDDASAAWQAIRELPIETRGSVFGTAMALFRAFGSPRVRAATSCTPRDMDNTLDIPDLLANNGTLYLVSPEYEQAELRPVFVALIQAVYRAAVDTSANLLDGAPLSPPLLLMLDEAGNIAPLHSLPKIAATGAGQGITLMTIWQDRAQIKEIYGDAERTVISNHSTSVWLPGSQDLDTLKLLSDLIGDQWVASATVSAAPDGGLSVSESSERIDVAPPAFLRTLAHGRAVMLSGNRPPALVTTHAYYQQRRWRRLVGEDVVERHAAMHDGTGPTTKERWQQQAHSQPPSDAPDDLHSPAAGDEEDAGRRGRLATAIAATHPPVLCDRHARHLAGPAGEAIPDELSSAPGTWHSIDLPDELACYLDSPRRVDLADAGTRRAVLALWLETGPAEQLARTVTFPQLRAEWPHLPLDDLLRHVWERCFPALRDDSSELPPAPAHPSLDSPDPNDPTA